MEISKKAITDEASRAGLLFGIISGLYIVVTGFAKTGILWSLLTMVLWALKFGACIWLMCFMMKRICAKYEGVTNSDTFRFGMLTALFSALITAVVAYLAAEFIFPEAMEERMNMAMEMYGSMLDSNSMDMMEKMMDKMPVINLISTFIWCFIYGTALSAIVSGRIPRKDPFAEYRQNTSENPDEQ